MVEGETKGFLDLITIDGDNAKIETVKDGFDGPVSLVQVGDTVDVLYVPLRYLRPGGKKEDPAATVHGVRSQSAAAVACDATRCGPTADRTGSRGFNVLASFALCAASSARSMSAADDRGAERRRLPVIGFGLSKYGPSTGANHFAPMKFS
jgi:hypothetical protein